MHRRISLGSMPMLKTSKRDMFLHVFLRFSNNFNLENAERIAMLFFVFIFHLRLSLKGLSFDADVIHLFFFS